MLGSLTQADATSLQTPFLVFSILILAALVIGAFSYMQLSNRYYKAKDELRRAKDDLKKASRWQRRYQRIRKAAQKGQSTRRAMKSAMLASRSCLYSVELDTMKVKFGKNIDGVLGLPTGEAKVLGLENYEVYRETIHPDDIAILDSGLQHLLEAPGYYEHSYRLMLPNGIRWIKASGEVVHKNGKPERIVGFIQDINELKELEFNLKENEAKFRMALASGDVAVFIQDEELRYTWVNNPMAGYKSDDLIGRKNDEVAATDPQLAPIMELKKQVLNSGKGAEKEFTLTSPNESRQHIRVFVEPYTFPDGKKGIIGTAYYITSLLETQKALADTANSLHMEKRLADEAAKNLREELGRRNRELTEARNLQLSMLPDMHQDLGHWQVAFSMEASEQVGGDFYDHYLNPEGDTLVVALGDATGHGIRAGIMGATVKSYFQSNVGRSSIEELQRTIHEAIEAMNLDNMFMALTLMEVGRDNLRVVMGGMPPLMLYRAADKTVEQLHNRSLFLGAPFDANYSVVQRPLAPGDVIVAVTDGMTESMDHYGEFLGTDRMADHLKEQGHLSPPEIVESLRQLHSNWYGTRPLKDDVTVAVVKLS